MKSLYVVRHGIAQKRGEGVDDDARELTARGRDRMKLVAKGLADAGVRFDAILTSPLARALQTARIVEKYCAGGDAFVETDLLKPGASFDRLIEQLNGLEGTDSVAIVGHEPDLSSFVSYCIADRKTSCVRLKKGGVALLEPDGAIGPWQCLLAWLLEPGQLIQL